MKQLRFAPIVRVSTEKQEKQGESLQTQKKQIIHYVNQLNGVIPKSCWNYSGQEHATAQFERKKFNMLIADASKNKFDAVIVCDPSRWSRDNLKSEKGIEILKKNNIRFFIGMSETDLYNPDQSLLLTITTNINAYVAQSSALKSITNRIEKAKKNIPACGSLPSGRTYDKKTGWGTNPEFKKKIEIAAKLLLEGKSLIHISKLINMNRTNLTSILTYRCGDIWKQHFKADRFKIDETIETKVPRLLEQDILDKVILRIQQNKTVFHAQLKYKYLLGRMILCGHCGSPLSGNTRKDSRLQYYRHPKSSTCKKFLHVPCKLIDDPAIIHLFSLFGNQSEMMKAVENAVPDTKDIGLKESRLIEISQELKKVNQRKIRLIDLYENEAISIEDFKPKMSVHTERESLLSDELVKLKNEIESVPKEEEIIRTADLIRCHIESIYSNGIEFENMSFEEKRKLAQFAFSGRDYQGQRSGVYVRKDGNEWSFEIKGVLLDSSILEYLPMNQEKANSILGIEEEHINITDRYIDEQESLRNEHVAGAGPGNKRADGGVLQKYPVRQNEPVPGAASGGS